MSETDGGSVLSATDGRENGPSAALSALEDAARRHGVTVAQIGERSRAVAAANADLRDAKAVAAACDKAYEESREAMESQGFPKWEAAEAIHDAARSVAPAGVAGKAVDLAALMRHGIPPVEYLEGDLARRMVYAMGVTGFTGHPAAGKTSLVTRLSVDAIRAGRHVVYLDWEQGEEETLRRFAAVGATTDDLEPERLTYLPFPGPPDWDDLGALWDEHPGALGVFDSTRGILRTLGLDEDRASEVGRFMDPLIEFALSRKVPCLLIDHVTKATNGTTGYSRGSGDKLAAVQAQWYVECTTAFSESAPGEITLTQWKARSGRMDRTHRLGVGDGDGNLTFRKLDPDLTPEGKIDAAVIAYLRGRRESSSLREIDKVVTGSAADVHERVKALATDPSQPVRAVEGGAHPRYEYDADLDLAPRPPLGF